MDSRAHATPVGGLGEAGILARVLPMLDEPEIAGPSRMLLGPGDDAAVLAAPTGRIVATTDALVSDQDFVLRATTGDLIGRKAAVQNIADVAAMGARPTALLAAISCPSDTPVALIEGIMRGLARRAGRDGARIVGGDLGTADELVVAITALGELDPGVAPVVRSGAREGDVLAVGSPLVGRSAAGLALILSCRCRVDEPEPGEEAPRVQLDGIDADAAAACVLWHDAPDPDLSLGWGAGRDAHAMLDISDGLVRDARRMAAASQVLIDLAPAALRPDAEALAPLASELGADPWQWVLHGGEEHAMLAAFASGEVPAGFRVIGRIRALASHEGLGNAAGETPDVLLGGKQISAHGWDHFES